MHNILKDSFVLSGWNNDEDVLLKEVYWSNVILVIVIKWRKIIVLLWFMQSMLQKQLFRKSKTRISIQYRSGDNIAM